jgi:seryl-tRNA synthetase
MLDIKRIRDCEDEVRAGVLACGDDPSVIGDILALDVKRRSLLGEVELLKGQRNKASKEIGALRKKGEDTAGQQTAVRDIGEQIAAFDEQVHGVEGELRSIMLRVPNVPHATAPVGPDETGNRITRTEGEPRKLSFEPKNHVEIGERLGIFDFVRAARMSGAGFPMLLGAGARLRRALIAFMLDIHTDEHGYVEVAPPFLCNSAAMIGTGQLPKLADDMYCLTGDDLYLVPTGEVPVTNIYRDEIIDKELPLYFVAYTPCFRREAGAAGKDTRGILRVHQFDKVELVKVVEPGSSYDELEKLLANAEVILKRLGLAYRINELCSGDMSFAAAKCYDIEVWSPGQGDWLEVSSCSNFESFQARRAGIRYRREDGKVDFAHTLNGSGLALQRLIVALLETYQEADGSVSLPEAIVPYMGGVEELTP